MKRFELWLRLLAIRVNLSMSHNRIWPNRHEYYSEFYAEYQRRKKKRLFSLCRGDQQCYHLIVVYYGVSYDIAHQFLSLSIKLFVFWCFFFFSFRVLFSVTFIYIFVCLQLTVYFFIFKSIAILANVNINIQPHAWFVYLASLLSPLLYALFAWRVCVLVLFNSNNNNNNKK